MVFNKCDHIHHANRMQCNQEAFAIVEVEGKAPHNMCLLHLHTTASTKQPITKIRVFDPSNQYVADKILTKIEPKKEEKKLPVMTIKASVN